MRIDFLVRADDYIVGPRDRITPDTLVLTYQGGTITALPIGTRLVILLWSPKTDSQVIQSAIDNLINAGFKGPFQVCRLATATKMLKRFIRDPEYLALRDATVSCHFNGTAIGHPSYANN